jgi:phospholipid N-methyltransferase
MKDSFIVQFFKKWKEVGAILPSSVFLIEDMLLEVDFKKAELIVEFGAGSGSFTRRILEKMRPTSRLVIFEINDVFVKKLNKIKDKRISVISDSAENSGKYLSGQKADYIISGIPLSNLSKVEKDKVISSAKNILQKDGLFLQFQYFPESFKFLKKYFSYVKLNFTFLNTPPAFFYVCRK